MGQLQSQHFQYGAIQSGIRLLILAVIAVVALTNLSGDRVASAAQVRLYDVLCAKVRVSGVTTVAAPYVHVRVMTANNLLNTLAEGTEKVLPAVGRSFDITVDFLEQAASTRFIIAVGEWDGSKYINPAVLYGQDCTAGPTVSLPAQPDQQFRSKTLGFTIQYPSQWTVQDQGDSVSFTSNEQIGSGPEPILYSVSASALPNPNGMSFEALANQSLPADLQATFTYIQRPVGAFTAYITEALPSQSGAVSAFLTRDGGRYVRLDLVPYDAQKPFPKQDDYRSLFEAMLNTFTME